MEEEGEMEGDLSLEVEAVVEGVSVTVGEEVWLWDTEGVGERVERRCGPPHPPSPPPLLVDVEVGEGMLLGVVRAFGEGVERSIGEGVSTFVAVTPPAEGVEARKVVGEGVKVTGEEGERCMVGEGVVDREGQGVDERVLSRLLREEVKEGDREGEGEAVHPVERVTDREGEGVLEGDWDGTLLTLGVTLTVPPPPPPPPRAVGDSAPVGEGVEDPPPPPPLPPPPSFCEEALGGEVGVV